MRMILSLAAAAACLAATGPPADVAANTAGYRQYYSNGKAVGQWHYYPQQKAYATYYKYKPVATATVYTHHVAYYYPARPKYVYYYNPQAKKYWGRCPLTPTKDNPYQILDYADRHENLDAIPEEKFKPLPYTLNEPEKPKQKIAGPMPPIPGSDDDEQMEPPPAPPAVTE